MKAAVLTNIRLLLIVLFATSLTATDMNGYLTVGIFSHHFSTDEQGDTFNDDHKAVGAELVWDQRYALAYLHFDNSRDRSTNIYALGYRYDVYGPFGIYAVAGYQNGYCFNGLKSVECTEGKDDSGFTFLPMLYYKHDCFILDLIAQQNMIALKLNLKLF
ncbi:MAG TPA: hypothetical protein VFX68_02825 [Sulfuricurvum sp.]|nr:hypothetical protein [Sulfuricurvum sp.]